MKPERPEVVPRAEPRTYYDQPVIAEPAWTWEVPWYFFAGGLAGASSTLATGARLAGQPELARAARLVAAAAATAAPPLLVSDLGRPERFLNMLRVFRITSPLSVGSWVLATYAPAAMGAALLHTTGRAPRLARIADTAAAALGPVMATYTAVLVADTAVPVWHEARRDLPAVFAASAAASAGAAALLLAPDAGGARRLATSAAAVELAAAAAMERRLGELSTPYHEGTAGRFATMAKWLTGSGALAVAIGRKHRPLTVIGACALLAGSVCQRWAVFRAGFASARDPRQTIAPQRARRTARDAQSPGG